MEQNNNNNSIFRFMPSMNEPNLQNNTLFSSPFNTVPISETNLQKGYGKELKSFVEKNEENEYAQRKGNRGLFSSNPPSDQEPREKIEIVRNTNLYQDSEGPWAEAPQALKLLFKEELVESNTFHFPTNLSNLFVQPTYATPSIFNSCCLPFTKCTYKPILDYICYNCIRTCKTIKYVICEKCFEPEQHEGHFYQKKKVENNRYSREEKQVCVCGKDLFEENEKEYRCKNHIKYDPTKQEPFEITANQIEIENTLKALINIAFYLQKELRNFNKVENMINNQYFTLWAEILDLFTLYVNSGEENLEMILNLLFKEFKYIEDLYSPRNESFGEFQSYYNEYNRKEKTNTLLNYVLVSLRELSNSKSLSLLLCENHQFLNIFINNFLTNKEKFSTITRTTPFTSSSLHIHLLEIYYQNEYFSALDEDLCKVFFQKHEKYYHYGLKYFETIMEERCSFSNPMILYLKSINSLFNFLQNVLPGPFLKYLGPEVLPEFLFCYVRLFKYEEHEDQFDREHYDENEDRQRWSKSNKKFYEIINRVLISLCDEKIDNLPNYYKILNQIEVKLKNKKTNRDANKVYGEGEGEENMNKNEDKEEEEFDNNEQNNYDEDCDGSEDFKTKAKREKIKENFEYYKNSYIKNTKYKLFEEFNKNDKTKLSFEKDEKCSMEESYLDDLMFFIFICVEENNETNVKNIVKYKKEIFGTENNQNFGRRNNNKIFWYNMEIYKTIKTLLFYQFNLPKYLEPNSKSESENESLIKSIFFYDKVFTSKELLDLKNKTNLHNFNQLVQKHLVFNFQTKKFYFNEETITKEHVNPLYKILSKTPDHVSFSDFKYFQEAIQRNGLKDILYVIIISSGFIQDQKKKLEELYNRPENWIQDFKMFMFLLMIGDCLANGKNEQISESIQEIKLENFFIFKGEISDSEKNQILSIIFDKTIESHNDKEVNEEQLPHSEEARQAKLLCKKEEKQKQINEKRSEILEKEGISIIKEENDEPVCAICREKSSPENEFIYPISIEINKTIAYSFFNEIDKAGIDIKINFTEHHFSCLIDTSEKNNKFNMSSPKQFIPVHYNIKNKKMNRRFSTMLTLSMTNPYLMENEFLPLFKFLIESKIFLSMINVHLYEKSKKKREKKEKFIFQFLIDMYQYSTNETQEEYQESVSNLLKEVKLVKAGPLAEVQVLFIECLFSQIKKETITLDSSKLKQIFKQFSQEEFSIFKREFSEIGVQHLNEFSEDFVQSFETANPKQQISKEYPMRLPKYSKELSLFRNEQCDVCKSELRSEICLICGFLKCENCQYHSSIHDQLHQNKTLQFNINKGTVKHKGVLSQNNSYNHFNNEEFCLYYNQLMIPFCEIPKNEQQLQIIELNEILYLGIAELLLQ